VRLAVVTNGQLRVEQMAPQLPVELHAKIGLAQRYKTRYVDVQVGMEILNIQPIEEKQPPHKRGTGEPKVALMEGGEHDHLAIPQCRHVSFLLQLPLGDCLRGTEIPSSLGPQHGSGRSSVGGRSPWAYGESARARRLQGKGRGKCAMKR
jgi:hypothetical protein